MPTEKSDIRKLDEEVGYHPETNFIIKLSIKEVDVPASAIVDIVLREWIFDALPRLEIMLSDNGRFIDQFPLEDNDKILIELNHFIFEEAPIKAQFTLQDYEIINSAPGKSQQALIKITALMDNNLLTFPIHNRSFSQMNSNEVFEAIFNETKADSKKLGLRKFDSRIKPQDEMNWLQINQNNLQFIKHVLDRSYFNDNDAPFLYTNRNGTMVYTSLRTELKKKQQEIPRLIYNIESSMLNSKNYQKEDLEDLLEEEKENEGNNQLFFYNWRYKNFSGGKNKMNSYGREFSYYDLTSGISRQITTDDHELSIHSLKEKNKIGKITRHDNYGVLDTSNMHDNFMLAKTQNDYLKENFFSSYMLVYTRPSNNLNLFDRVNVEVDSLLPIESARDEVHSGQYIVGGIIHQASKDSIYNNIVILFRNGLDVKGLLKDFESRHSSKKSNESKISNPLKTLRFI